MQKQKQTNPSPKKVLTSIKHPEGSLGKLQMSIINHKKEHLL